MTSERDEILALRAKKLTPKQIARKLGLKVSQVSSVIKAEAKQLTNNQLTPVVECFVDRNCFDNLLMETPENDYEERGLGQVTVVRSGRYNRYLVGAYLVDYWCLAVKDTIEVREVNRDHYQLFIKRYYERFERGYETITLQQAQAIVWGAVAYAGNLGLKPHPDFEKTKAHLGDWDGQPQLSFGRKGRPCYIEGSYDDYNSILETLRKNVGEGQFDHLLPLDIANFDDEEEDDFDDEDFDNFEDVDGEEEEDVDGEGWTEEDLKAMRGLIKTLKTQTKKYKRKNT